MLARRAALLNSAAPNWLPPALQHYTHKAMAPWFKESGGNVTHADVLQHFTKLRQMGVRLHYWP